MKERGENREGNVGEVESVTGAAFEKMGRLFDSMEGGYDNEISFESIREGNFANGDSFFVNRYRKHGFTEEVNYYVKITKEGKKDQYVSFDFGKDGLRNLMFSKLGFEVEGGSSFGLNKGMLIDERYYGEVRSLQGFRESSKTLVQWFRYNKEAKAADEMKPFPIKINPLFETAKK